MAKPTENKEDKNLNKKLDLSPSMMIALSNIVMIVIIVISLIIMYVLIDHSMDKKLTKLIPQEGQEQLEEGEGDTKQEGILLDLGEFILNLADINTRRYLKAGVAMELSKTQEEIDASASVSNAKPSGGHGHGAAPAADPNELIIAEMERYKPAIRDAVIQVLSSKTSEELSTTTGKEIAKEEILEIVNSVFEGKREVLRVSFGQFVIQ